MGESNGVIPTSAAGYKQTLAGLKITSASPPGADLPGGVAEGPFLTLMGHCAVARGCALAH